MAIWVLLILWQSAKNRSVLLYGVVFDSWFFIGVAFCPSVFELSFLISICLCVPFGGCLSLNEVVDGDLEAYLFFAVFFFW